MLRKLLETLRHKGIDIKSKHRLDAGSAYTVQSRLLEGQDVRVVFDCGAHHGRVSQIYRSAFPHAQVYGFEPTPDTFKVIQNNLRGLDRIEIINAAVGSASGTLDFFMVGDEQCNSLAKPDPSATAVKVKVVALDDFCAERKIAHVDVLKMDIQGYELQALKGASKLLENQSIDVVFSEFFFDPPVPDATHLLELADFLRTRGYRLFGLYETMYDMGLRALWGDAIFVSDAHLERYQKRVGTVSPQETIREMLKLDAAKR